MDAAITTALSTAVTAIGTLITSNLPAIFAIAGSLLALGIVWRLVRKFVRA